MQRGKNKGIGYIRSNTKVPCSVIETDREDETTVIMCKLLKTVVPLLAAYNVGYKLTLETKVTLGTIQSS